MRSETAVGQDVQCGTSDKLVYGAHLTHISRIFEI